MDSHLRRVQCPLPMEGAQPGQQPLPNPERQTWGPSRRLQERREYLPSSVLGVGGGFISWAVKASQPASKSVNQHFWKPPPPPTMDNETFPKKNDPTVCPSWRQDKDKVVKGQTLAASRCLSHRQ